MLKANFKSEEFEDPELENEEEEKEKTLKMKRKSRRKDLKGIEKWEEERILVDFIQTTLL